MSEELLQGLCERARAQGTAVSTLVAQLLEESISPSNPGEPEPPASFELADVLARIENTEKWIQLLLAIQVSGDEDWTLGENVPCPGCGETELAYLEAKRDAEPDAHTVSSFLCGSCSWYVQTPLLPNTDAAAGRPCEQPAGEGDSP